MALHKVSAWFVSDAGRKVSYLFAGGATTLAMLANYVPHTAFVEEYKNFLHLYRNGFHVLLTPELKQRFEKALELAGIPEGDHYLFKPFACFGFDVTSIGTSYSRWGAYIGIPANFFYHSVDDIDKCSIKLRDASVSWDTDEGILLEKSLILSEKAQIYAMAREIKYRDTPKLLLDTSISVSSVVGAYGTANLINKRLNLYTRSLAIRAILYGLVGALWFGNYAMLKDCSQVYYEGQIDKELKERNPLFKEGGREFYAKTLARNVALRHLLGKEGEKAYTITGNENYLLRYKHIPLVQRKQSFEEAAA